MLNHKKKFKIIFIKWKWKVLYNLLHIGLETLRRTNKPNKGASRYISYLVKIMKTDQARGLELN